MKINRSLRYLLLGPTALFLHACKDNNSPSQQTIDAIDLNRGAIISCGNSENEFGTLSFDVTVTEKAKEDFDLAVKLLHSFEYLEAEKAFAKVIDNDPACAMAYWGIAMSNFHPLWSPPTPAELQKGLKAIAIAKSVNNKSARETAYIDAIAYYYTGWEKSDHHTRSIRLEEAMKKVYTSYPDDMETAIFYALALTAAADPTDKTYAKQKAAGKILNSLSEKAPNHPGIVHYIIHTYDSPELAQLALPAAKKYAAVAPSSAHALHMPSHIFTRLGLWEEDIQSNLSSVEAAVCYAKAAGFKGHWDEELHGLDYLVYAYLQRGDNAHAKAQWEYLQTIKEIAPLNFKVAYSFAAIPARYLLENRIWEAASRLQAPKANFDWQQFPWENAIVHFTRLLGSVNTGKLDSAKAELAILEQLQQELLSKKDPFKASKVDIQVKTGQAWIHFKEGKNQEAISLMSLAADLEDRSAKHPVTPGDVIPARELLGDLLLQMNRPAEALQAYEASLEKTPNRFNGLYGAALAAEKTGDKTKARLYNEQLLKVADPTSTRPELAAVKNYIQNQ